MRVDQRDIVLISLNPTRGREQKGTRPAVVISGNAYHHSSLCIVCPLTTTIHSFVGNIILKPDTVNNLDKTSEVLVGHVRTISFDRLSKKIGSITEAELEGIFKGIDLILDR